MNIELLGGPHDGQTMAVPDHLMQVTIPVPGSGEITPRFSSSANYASSLWVARYDRWGVAGHRVFYRYSGQEQISA